MIFLLSWVLVFTVGAVLVIGLKRRSEQVAKFFRLPGDAVQTLLGMSARLACSAHHISGFTPQRIRSDLRNYSPLFSLVSIEQRQGVTRATIGNIVSVKAHFYPRYGCTLIDAQKPQILPRHPLADSPLSGVSKGVDQRKKNTRPPALQELVESQLRHDHESGLDTRALLVIQEGEILAEAYGAGITRQTPLLGWSMSKSLLAILFGRLETLGLTDAARGDLFPEWQNDRRCEITLHQLLQMCDGLAFDETYRPGTDATRMLFGPLPASRYALQRPLAHSPGRHFSYASGSTNLVARWMHQTLGGTEATLAFWKTAFAAPLGLTSTMLELDGDGVFIGSSYGYASAREWGRIGATLLGGYGVGHNPQPFLDPTWLTRALTPNQSDNDPRYGYQLWLNNRTNQLPQLYPQLPADSFYMLGNREQKLMVAPSHNAVVVRLGWSASPYPIEDRFGEILQLLPH